MKIQGMCGTHKDMQFACMQCLYRGTLQKQLRTYWQEGLSLLDIIRINEGDAASSSRGGNAIITI